MKIFRFIFIYLAFTSAIPMQAQRISVNGTKFNVEGKEIFINGANTPWDNWNDFGGNYNSTWWNTEFARIKNAGGNSTRIWISCNGDVGINISSDGTVTGATDAFWSDLDDMFQLAENNKIYIKATLISFDHFKNTYIKYQSWRNMINNNDKVSSFVDNYVVLFVNRYKDNPYLWAIDVCNEIEWVNQNAECGNIEWSRLQYLVARVASAVHDNSDVLVTLGSAAVKWNSPIPGCEGNYWSDENLKAQYNVSNAILDFYSPHYYGWVVRWFGDFALNRSPASYQINDRPCIVGECPAKGVFNDVTLEVTPEDMFIGAYNNGWCGVMPWTSNGSDINGNLNDFDDGLLEFQRLYPQLVDPYYITSIDKIFVNKTHYSNKLLVGLYPNPSYNEVINIQLAEYSHTFIQITDISGKILYLKKAKENLIKINTETLGKGIFIVSAIEGKLIESKKIELQ